MGSTPPHFYMMFSVNAKTASETMSQNSSEDSNDMSNSKQKIRNKPLSTREKKLAAEAMEYFIQYVSSPWRIIWNN